MTPVTVFRGRTLAVFGLGSSGLAACAALAAGGANVVAFDDAADKVAAAAAQGFSTRDLRTLDWQKVSALVLAPGVPLTHPAPHWSVQLARKAGVEVIGDVELFCRERRANAPEAPFVAVTGTNGKSTTTALIAHILVAGGHDTAVGGNLGAPVLSLAPPDPERVHVIECSSFQIDLAPTLDPSVGVLLNLTPDHLDRHGTLRDYAAIKERLIAGVPAGGAAVIGVDDDFCRTVAVRAESGGKRLVRVSVLDRLADGIFLDGDRLAVMEGGERRFSVSLAGIGSLRGAHNAQNAACALAAAHALGVPVPAIERVLASFPGLAHRMEQVGRSGPVLFVNDSKATNADSTARALASFSDIYWIAGGRAKEGGLAGLEVYFPRIRKAYLIGEAAAAFAAALASQGVAHEIAGTLDRAVEHAASDAGLSQGAEAVVLLSPACASYDQYANFEVRGDRFRELVRALPGVTPPAFPSPSG